MNEELRIKITAQIADAQKNLKEVQAQLGKVGTDGEKSASKLGASFKKMGDVTKQALGVAAKATAAATAAAAAGVVALTKSAVESYAEYEQLVGGIDTLFKDSSQKVQQYAQDAFKTAGMGANDYMALVTSFSASLLQSVGGDTEKAAEAANQAIIDMADNANKMGTSMESIQNAYQGFAKQNYTMLDNLKLGYGGTKEEMQRLLEDAEKISGIKYDISNLNDVYSAIHVIQTELGITGTTAAEASSTIQGSAAAMKGAWSNLVTGLADENADFDKLLGNFIDSVGKFAENLVPRIQTALGGVVKLISGLVPQIVAELPKLVGTLLPQLLTAVIDIVNGITQALPDLIGALVEGIVTALPMLLESIAALLPVVLEVIVQIIPQLLDAILQAIPLLIETIVTVAVAILENLGILLPQILEQIIGILPQIIQSVVDNIPVLLDAAINFLLAIVQAIPEIIPQLIQTLPDIINSILNCVVENIPKLLQAAITLFTSLVNAIPVILPVLVEELPDIIDTIITTLLENLPLVIDGAVELFMGIVTALPEILPMALDAVGEIMSEILSNIGKYALLIGEVIITAIDGAIRAAIQSVLATAVDIINRFISAINLVINVINAIPGVDIGKLNPLKVPRLAKGGVVDGATIAMIGEQGKEAVVPLENNLEWLDKMATMLAERMGGGNKPIILEVDGQVFATTAINTINQNTQQTGRLALNIM